MDNAQIRMQNITAILQKKFKGKKVSLANAIEKNPVIVQRWFSTGKGHRNLGDKVAREIEGKLNLPRGWLDNMHEKMHDLEDDPQEKARLKIQAGETHVIPVTGNAILDHGLQLTIINNNIGKLMLLSTDGDAYAFQLVGHNANPLLDNHWGLVIEPNTPVTLNEYAIVWLKGGEVLLRLVVFMDEQSLLLRHPITNEQQRVDRLQIDKIHYCYVGIPPSKISPTPL